MPTKVDLKIARFQELFPHMDRDYRSLLSAFETLKPVMDLLISRHLRSGEPVLCYVARPFLEKYQRDYAKVIKKLEYLYLERPELIVRWKSTIHCYFMPKPISQAAATGEEQRKEFWQRMGMVRSEWALLEAERKKLDNPRNMIFAHLQLEEVALESPQEALDQQGQEEQKARRIVLQAISLPTLEEVWQTLQDLVPRIGNTITQLGYLLLKADVGYDLVRRSAKNGASTFWHSAN
jgi:hypothetical protein